MALPNRPLRIVIVEDDDDASDSLWLLVKALGHRPVLIAHNGRAAVRAVREFKPDAVLLDLMLPFVDGREVARQLRTDEELRTTAIVAVTALAGPEEERLSREAGIDQHLAKPFDVEELGRVLDQVTAGTPCGPNPRN